MLARVCWYLSVQPTATVHIAAYCHCSQSEGVQFVDVREQREWDLARVSAFTLMPLSTFSEWSEKVSTMLDPSKETVCMCHHGMRSMQMAQYLTSQGAWHVSQA